MSIPEDFYETRDRLADLNPFDCYDEVYLKRPGEDWVKIGGEMSRRDFLKMSFWGGLFAIGSLASRNYGLYLSAEGRAESLIDCCTGKAYVTGLTNRVIEVTQKGETITYPIGTEFYANGKVSLILGNNGSAVVTSVTHVLQPSHINVENISINFPNIPRIESANFNGILSTIVYLDGDPSTDRIVTIMLENFPELDSSLLPRFCNSTPELQEILQLGQLFVLESGKTLLEVGISPAQYDQAIAAGFYLAIIDYDSENGDSGRPIFGKTPSGEMVFIGALIGKVTEPTEIYNSRLVSLVVSRL